jgi:hypothetical protein
VIEARRTSVTCTAEVRGGQLANHESINSRAPFDDQAELNLPGGTSNDVPPPVAGPVPRQSTVRHLPLKSGCRRRRRHRHARCRSRARSPGDGGTAHATVTFVAPLSARAVPNQKRAGRPRDGSASALSAEVIAVGASGFGGAEARAASAAVNAQYPLRARTSIPRRFTETLISWNLPSVGASVEL